MSEIKISQEQDIIKNKTIRTIRIKYWDQFKLGKVISTLLNWNEKIDGEFKKAKKAVLFEEYFNLVDNHEDAINKLKIFITNPQGIQHLVQQY